MNAKLSAIADKAAADLKGLIVESETKILEAWNAAETEAQENEKKLKFKLGFVITLDLEKDQMDSSLSYGVKRKVTASSKIPDPNQPELPATDPVVGDDDQPLTEAQSKKALKALNKQATGK